MCITSADRPKKEADPQLKTDLENQDASTDTLCVDRSYINSALIDDAQSDGGEVLCKPWLVRAGRPDLFEKKDFKPNMRGKTITCPVGQVEAFEPGQVVECDSEVCGSCRLRSNMHVLRFWQGPYR